MLLLQRDSLISTALIPITLLNALVNHAILAQWYAPAFVMNVKEL